MDHGQTLEKAHGQKPATSQESRFRITSRHSATATTAGRTTPWTYPGGFSDEPPNQKNLLLKW